MNMIIHDDGHTNVITSDGLVSDAAIKERTGNKGFEYGTFDFIITNPPFGSNIRQTEQAYLKTYQLGKRKKIGLRLKLRLVIILVMDNKVRSFSLSRIICS